MKFWILPQVFFGNESMAILFHEKRDEDVLIIHILCFSLCHLFKQKRIACWAHLNLTDIKNVHSFYGCKFISLAKDVQFENRSKGGFRKVCEKKWLLPAEGLG